MPEFLTDITLTSPVTIVLIVLIIAAGVVLWMKKEGKGPFGQ